MASQANSPHDPEEKRLVFIDALRVAAIVFVIVHHAAQAYGPTGGFWPVHALAKRLVHSILYRKCGVWHGIDVSPRRIFRAAVL